MLFSSPPFVSTISDSNQPARLEERQRIERPRLHSPDDLQRRSTFSANSSLF